MRQVKASTGRRLSVRVKQCCNFTSETAMHPLQTLGGLLKSDFKLESRADQSIFDFVGVSEVRLSLQQLLCIYTVTNCLVQLLRLVLNSNELLITEERHVEVKMFLFRAGARIGEHSFVQAVTCREIVCTSKGSTQKG